MKQYYKQVGEQKVFFNGVLIANGMQIFNPTEEQLLNDGWTELRDYVTEDIEYTHEESVQIAKDLKLSEIDSYDKSDAVNSFSINGQSMWLDASLRQQLRTSIMAYQALGIEDEISKWFNGVEYTFTATQWLRMLNLLEVYAAESLNATESHKASVNALDNVEEIESYDITDGYPQKLTF